MGGSVTCLNEDTNEFLTNILLDRACQSPLMMEISSFAVNIQPCCNKLYTEMFASEETNMLVTQHTSVWHQERQYGVTSSRCYDIFTYSKHVWEMKSMKYFWPKKFTNKYVRHGAQQASHARNCFMKLYSVNVVEFDFITSHSNPWLGVSPDEVIFHENEPVGILEIKCHFEGAVKPIEELLEAIKYIQKKMKILTY